VHPVEQQLGDKTGARAHDRILIRTRCRQEGPYHLSNP
jgi:hypothetical protein